MNGLVVSVSAFLVTEADTNWAIVGVVGTTAKPTITMVTTSRGSTTLAGAYTYLPFGPPASFSPTATSTSQVALSWTPVDSATSYEVYRSSLNTPYIPVATITTGGTIVKSAHLTELRAGTQ